MFTGLIQHLGKVVRWSPSRISVETKLRSLVLGESISINGVCLTVASRKGSVATFDVGPETLRVTTLGKLNSGSAVNIERALRAGESIGGHFVTGHVDGIGKIVSLSPEGLNWWLTVEVPTRFKSQIMEKGSIAIDGISLTIVKVQASALKLMIVPYTYRHTTISTKKKGHFVNIETDVLAKYVQNRKK